MERLTKRAVSVRGEYKVCCPNFMKHECKMNTGECGLCSTNDAVWEKLAAYEDAEEAGLLVRLPCKVGDRMSGGEVIGIEYAIGNRVDLEIEHESGVLFIPAQLVFVLMPDGKSIKALTYDKARADAEKALK